MIAIKHKGVFLGARKKIVAIFVERGRTR
jgi:hypothetical protein